MAAERSQADVVVDIVIVENHALYRKGLRTQLDTDPGMRIVAECDNATEAVRTVLELRPSVVLMDLHLPRVPGARPTYCGAQAITEILKDWPEANIAVITMFDNVERVREALKAGARSYVSKDGDPREVLDVVRLTAHGTAVLDREVSDVVKKILPSSSKEFTRFSELGARENEQLALAAAGDTDKQIAEKLQIATKTVANYWSNIRHKLDVPTRDAAIELARADGFQSDGGAPCDPGDVG